MSQGRYDCVERKYRRCLDASVKAGAKRATVRARRTAYKLETLDELEEVKDFRRKLGAPRPGCVRIVK